jgi:signal transduction histidine kinase
MKVTISIYGMDREFRPIAGEEIYRIGCEAIRNACTHSGGTKLKIEHHYRRRFFELNISDNGRGIDAALLQAGEAGHYGVIEMRERAASLGGTLDIRSMMDLGTTVSLRVPGNAVYLHKPWLL